MTGMTQRKAGPTTEMTVADTIHALRRSFLSGLDERICQIETAWVAVASGSADAREALAEIEFEVHRISGIAGSLGLSALGAKAQDLELLIAETRKDSGTRDMASKLDAQVNAFLDLMESELEHL